MSAIVCGLFFLSGASALIFETLWFRLAGLTFGNSVWASSLVLSAFMAGLALGSALAGRRGPRLKRPLGAYGLLELIVGATGFGLVLLLPQLQTWLAPLFQEVRGWPAALNALRFLTAAGLMVVPCTAMGATLPILTRALAAEDPNFGRVLGRLYGWNTLGAVAGALAGEALLIPAIGLRATGLLAALLSLVAAAAALGLAGRGRQASQPEVPTAAQAGPGWRLLLASAVAGAILLGLEVIWFRFLLLFIHGTSVVFAVMLAVVLAGIGLGGLLGARWLALRPNDHTLTPHMALLSGATCVATYAFYHFTLGALPQHPLYGTGALQVALPLVAPTSILSGVLFTLMGRAVQARTGGDVGPTGALVLANTLGAMIGSLAAGFVLLPFLGVESSLFVLAVGYGFVAWLALPAAGPEHERRSGRMLVAVALVFTLAAVLFPFGRMRSTFLPYRLRAKTWERKRIEAIREGRTETAIYLRDDFLGEPRSHILLTDSYAMSNTQNHGQRYMRLFVYWPLALRPQARSALLVGYGVGTTARAMVESSLETIDIVDISRNIIDLGRLCFRDPADWPPNDPRVRVHIEDGRFFLRTSQERYDLITGEPPPPQTAGVTNLYSREYFGLVRERLSDQGIATHWLPVYQLEEGDTRAIVRAFCDVFDDCSLWAGSGFEWMLAGSRGSRHTPPSAEDFGRQWRDPRVAAQLRRIGLETPADLGALFLADAALLRDLTRADEPLVDDRPGRISGHVPPRLSDLYVRLLDSSEIPRRFASSQFIAESWPPSLVPETQAAVPLQSLMSWAIGNPPEGAKGLRYDLILKALTQTQSEALPRMLLGAQPAMIDIAVRLEERGRGNAITAYELGLSALARRQYGEANRRLAHAQELGDDGADIPVLRLLAEHLGDRPDAARALLAQAKRGVDAPTAAWLESLVTGEQAPTSR